MSAGLPAPRRVDIRAIRERFGLTQADVADSTHVDERTVRRWEAGRSSPSPMALAHIRSLQRKLTQARADAGADAGLTSSGATESQSTGQAQASAGAGAEAGLMPRRRLPSL